MARDSSSDGFGHAHNHTAYMHLHTLMYTSYEPLVFNFGFSCSFVFFCFLVFFCQYFRRKWYCKVWAEWNGSSTNHNEIKRLALHMCIYLFCFYFIWFHWFHLVLLFFFLFFLAYTPNSKTERRDILKYDAIVSQKKIETEQV